MSKKHSGSCLCGKVRYEIDGDFERFFLCHCHYCQKDTGSAHAANLFSTSATLKWLSGFEKVTVFNLPSTRHTKAFCAVCGSPVPQQSTGNLLVVPAASLDSAITIPPDAHLYMASRAAWEHDLENLPRYDGLPA